MLLSTSVQGSILGSQRLVNNWKVLIYMQADNDLANYAFWDLAELESASNNTIPVLVELDLPGNDGIKRLKINPQPKLGNLDQYDFSNWGLDRLNSEVVKELQETEIVELKEKLQKAKATISELEHNSKPKPTDEQEHAWSVLSELHSLSSSGDSCSACNYRCCCGRSFSQVFFTINHTLSKHEVTKNRQIVIIVGIIVIS